ncbi:MAG: asparagine synthase (glutamine-hydrolysing) [Rhodospirillaceae bacterium]|nr:MAG: asparagine synthase (glutamine-hydrolysing) [Rhodospirillaceae bacterium]
MRNDGRPVDTAVLTDLADAMAHRGPDGRGCHVAGTVGLVQTRLAIIDLANGTQPFHHAEGGLSLVANGEIYNYLELRAGLGTIPFASQSDCEPPLYLYHRQGLSFTHALRGMYAIAIHDRHGPRERLVLARDPFGIKPLYYAETAMGFVFASEPCALIAAGMVRPRLDPRRAVELLQLQFTTGTQCLLAGIKRVAPGETVVVEGGRVVARHHQPALPAVADSPEPRDPVAALDRVLREAVAMHQRSDVPYGMFLSGGVDSSALLAMMARLNERPVLTFTAYFPDTDARDERAFARAVAAAAGAESVDVPFTEADFWTLLPDVVTALDDPAADYATVPTYKLAREARKAVKVILSGEGGDEVFAGYGRYRGAMRPWPFTRPLRRKGILDGFGLWRQEPTGWREGIAAAERVAHRGSRLQRAQSLDCADWLPNDLLGKLDRCLMAHGVEGRVPFLDLVLARFAYGLPDAYKIRRGVGKWLLRRWLAEALPAARPFVPKRGFTVPVGSWIARRGRALGPLVARVPAIAEWCSPVAVEALFAAADHGPHAGLAAWVLLFHALWVRRHVEGVGAHGDVFALLEA